MLSLPRTAGFPMRTVQELYQFILSRAKFDYVLLTLLGLLTYSLFLGSYPLIVPDEARYSEIAREMVANHQYLTPQLNGFNFFDKPILFYWLQATAIGLFGSHIWVIRLVPMLFGIAGALLVYNITAYISHRKIAWLAALLLLSSPLYFGLAHYADLNIEIAVWITASLGCFLRAYCPQQQDFHKGWLYAAYAAAGAAILTKGLMGIVFPTMVIGLWVAITSQWKLILRMRLVTGLLLICAIALPWFFAMQWKYPEFFNYFFVIQQFVRFSGTGFNNPQPFWFYLPVILFGLFPWSILLYAAVKHAWQTKNNSTWFLLIWASAIFVFFSIPESKIIGYITPVIFPLIILIAQYYPYASSKLKTATAIGSLLTAAMILIMLLIPTSWQITYGITASFKWLLCGVALWVISTIIYSLYRRPYKLFSILITINLIWFNVVLASYQLLTPTIMEHMFPIYHLTKQVRPIIHKDTQVIMYYTYFQDLPLYLGKTVPLVHTWTASELAGEDSAYGTFGYSLTHLTTTAPTTVMPAKQLQVLWQSNQPVLIFVTHKKTVQLAKLLKTSQFNIIAQAGNIQVISNTPL
jgi:4-amino-4-deoxy-L-arabinose transferase-like glycosyltransferase